MRLRWLLIATFTMLTPSMASARRPIYEYRGVSIQEMEAEGKGDPATIDPATIADVETPAPVPPYRCGLAVHAPPPPTPAKRSDSMIGLAIVGLLVAFRIRKRAGTDEAHVPDCLP